MCWELVCRVFGDLFHMRAERCLCAETAWCVVKVCSVLKKSTFDTKAKCLSKRMQVPDSPFP